MFYICHVHPQEDGRLVLRPGSPISTLACITLALCALLLLVSFVNSRGAHAARARNPLLVKEESWGEKWPTNFALDPTSM
jgi:hypothetical protein